MADTKHTPGPWEIMRNGHGCAFGVRSADAKMKISLPCCVPFDEAHPHETPDHHLIAAAPDLLAACEALLREIDSQHMAPVCSAEEAGERLRGPHRAHDYLQCDHACVECVPGGEAIIAGFRCGYHRARAAIARAKGAP